MMHWFSRLFSSFTRWGAAIPHRANETAQAYINRGNALLAQGQLDAAADCYQQAISILPGHAEAHNGLGMVFHQQHQFAIAEHHFKQAIVSSPEMTNAHCNLGSLLQEQGRLDDAIASFRQAVVLPPLSAPLLRHLGDLLQTQNRLDDAVPCYERALTIDPQLVQAHNNLATALRKLGRAEEALECFQKLIRLKPDFLAAHYNRGVILQDIGRLDEAAACFRTVVDLNPDYVDAHFNLGAICHAQDQLDEASAFLRRAISLKPDCSDFHNLLGQILRTQGQLSSAAASLERAIAIDPGFALAHKNLGLVLHDQGKLDEAEACYLRALSLDPTINEARFNLAIVFLTRGEIAKGWANYEYRFLPNVGIAKRGFPYPEWSGESLGNKTLLIWGEQGIGDEISFANLLPDMIAQAGRCVIECAPKLVPLFARSFPAAQVVPRSEPPHPATLTGIDYQSAAGSLAQWLRPTVEDFPVHDGYLQPDSVRVTYWQSRLATLGPGLKVGIGWRSTNLSGVRHLYCTTLDQWGPILGVPGVHFVNLQYDESAAELDKARQRFGIPIHVFDEVDLFDDLPEAAALNKALDLVIAAPTSVSVLSAALGVPTWMMTYGTTRQTLGTDHVPWFPSMRLFSRRWDQPWDSTVAAVAQALQTHVSSSAGGSS